MIAVIIVSAIILFILLLLLLPLSVRIKFDGEAFIKVRYARIITLYNSEKKEKGENAPSDIAEHPRKDTAKKGESFITDELERLGIKDFIVIYGGAAKEILSKLLRFIRRLKIKLFLIDLTVATDNAYDTAIEYGAVCAAIYPVLSIICSNAKVKLKKINISSDFTKTSYELILDTDIACSVITAVLTAFKFYKFYSEFKKERELNIKKGEINE